jgi:hypothetical protein
MISRNMPLQNVDLGFLAFFAHRSTHPLGHFALQYLVAILGDPDNVQMDRKNSVGTMPILTHAPKLSERLLKLPPKGGGFNP